MVYMFDVRALHKTRSGSTAVQKHATDAQKMSMNFSWLIEHESWRLIRRRRATIIQEETTSSAGGGGECSFRANRQTTSRVNGASIKSTSHAYTNRAAYEQTQTLHWSEQKPRELIRKKRSKACNSRKLYKAANLSESRAWAFQKDRHYNRRVSWQPFNNEAYDRTCTNDDE